jgi:hypothetical protein
MAWINAWSSGGKGGLTPPAGTIVDGEIASGPAPSPALHLSQRKADRLSGVLVSQAGSLMQEQHEAITLNDLNRGRSSPNRFESILHEIVGEGTRSRQWTWHSGFLSLPGFFGGSPPYTKGLN